MLINTDDELLHAKVFPEDGYMNIKESMLKILASDPKVPGS
jgi:hypothetical protein